MRQRGNAADEARNALRAAAVEICLRPPVDYAYTSTYSTYIRMHPVVVVAAASIIVVAAIAAAIDSLSAE